MASEQLPAEHFIRFVDSFRPDNRPDVLAISGGEAMLRPRLIRDLAERARRVGCRTSALSGLFFAPSGKIPPLIRSAIAALDHFSVSTDQFHEREVPREAVFNILEILISEGTDVSLHLVAQEGPDPYLEELISAVDQRFDGSVPMMVNRLSRFGRAREWLDAAVVPEDRGSAEPCALTDWPVVGFDGTVVACSNDDALDQKPAHLRLGHIATDDWSTIKDRSLQSAMVRAIRVFGPEYLADRYREGGLGCDGYCGTCLKLTPDSAFETKIDTLMARPAIAALEKEVLDLQYGAGTASFLRRHGESRYADLINRGVPA